MIFVRSRKRGARRAARSVFPLLSVAGRGASALAMSFALPLAACGSEDERPEEPGRCNVVSVESPPASARHVTQCEDISYSTNPPSGGEHYGVWAAFQSYDFPLSAGYLVHDLEHGAVVFWYDCPEGCEDDVASVQALIDALPEDPLCAGTGASRRAILVPYPALGTRWGVSAWGHALSADCVDEAAFTDFYTRHYAQGPEQLCNAGQAFTADPCP